MTVFVVDLGGTWLRTATFEPRTRVVTGLCRQATPDTAEACRGAIEAAWHRAGRLRRVGFAAAPTLDRSGVVRAWSNRPAYVGHSVTAALVGHAHIVSVDDGTAAAISAHAAWGVAADIVLAITIGTGVGGGAVIFGRPLVGAAHAAMNLGHLKVPAAAGRICSCGEVGCLQAVASGRALAAAMGEGVPEAAALDRAAEGVRELLAMLVRTFDPDRIALSGGVGLGPLHSRLATIGPDLPLRCHPSGDCAGLVGAGLLAAGLTIQPQV